MNIWKYEREMKWCLAIFEYGVKRAVYDYFKVLGFSEEMGCLWVGVHGYLRKLIYELND